MSDRSCDTGFAPIVQGNGTEVAQRQLQLTLALLAGNTARYRTVHLVGQPVLAGYSFQLQDIFQIVMQFRFLINHRLVRFRNRMVFHNRARRLAEHIFQFDIDGLHSVCLFEDKLHVVRRLTDNIHRGTFAVGNAFHTLYVFFLQQETHALLTFVSDDFLG